MSNETKLALCQIHLTEGERMPEGWKVVSVPEDLYEHLIKKWEENKKQYKIRYGVTSFSGFVTRILYRLIEEDQRRDQQQSNP